MRFPVFCLGVLACLLAATDAYLHVSVYVGQVTIISPNQCDQDTGVSSGGKCDFYVYLYIGDGDFGTPTTSSGITVISLTTDELEAPANTNAFYFGPSTEISYTFSGEQNWVEFIFEAWEDDSFALDDQLIKAFSRFPSTSMSGVYTTTMPLIGYSSDSISWTLHYTFHDTPCWSFPCKYGTCVATGDVYSCVCPNGITGGSCETNIDDCASSPCSNGGTCVDGIDTFTCVGSSSFYCLNGGVRQEYFKQFESRFGVFSRPLNFVLDISSAESQFGGRIKVYATADLSLSSEYIRIRSGSGAFTRTLFDWTMTDCVQASTSFAVSAWEISQIKAEGGLLTMFVSRDVGGSVCQLASLYFEFSQPLAMGFQTCSCPAGFTGSVCETNINECSSAPCQNGASCADAVNGYTCSCFSGYAGTTCQTNINECASIPCQNGAICADAVNGYICSCPPGYTDTHCEININDCTSAPCQNSGACSDGVNSYICFCPPGYTDTHCETDINECSSAPCQNGATCADAVNGYICSCFSGYAGSTCQTNINDCPSNACSNHGTCSDGVNSYTCSCFSGYAGTNCQTNVNECASTPCQNGGTCADGTNEYTCSCDPGFSGSSCSINVDECLSGPCQPPFVCVDGVASFTCECPNGLTGPTCQTRVDLCASSPCSNSGSCRQAEVLYLVLGNSFAPNTQVFSFANTFPGTYLMKFVSNADLGLESEYAYVTGGGAYLELLFWNYATVVDCTIRTQTLALTTAQVAAMRNPDGTMELKVYYASSVDDTCPHTTYTSVTLTPTGVNVACDCPQSFTGVSCETFLGECASSPCGNGGTCTNGIGSFACSCPPGFIGATCSINVNECASNPCGNGGTCTDGVNSFACTCLPNYTGSHCAIMLRPDCAVVHVDSSGGSVAGSSANCPDGGVSFSVPTGAIAPGNEITVQVFRVSQANAPSTSSALLSELERVTDFVELQPAGTTFQAPYPEIALTTTAHLSASEWSRIRLFVKSAALGWEEVDDVWTTLSTGKLTVHGRLHHFSIVVGFVARDSPVFSIAAVAGAVGAVLCLVAIVVGIVVMRRRRRRLRHIPSSPSDLVVPKRSMSTLPRTSTDIGMEDLKIDHDERLVGNPLCLQQTHRGAAADELADNNDASAAVDSFEPLCERALPEHYQASGSTVCAEAMSTTEFRALYQSVASLAREADAEDFYQNLRLYALPQAATVEVHDDYIAYERNVSERAAGANSELYAPFGQTRRTPLTNNPFRSNPHSRTSLAPVSDTPPVVTSMPKRPASDTRAVTMNAERTTLMEKLAREHGMAREQIEMDRELGRGEFGVVFKAFASEMQKMVAVKTLRPNATSKDEADFLSEAKLQGGFKHENVLGLIGVCLETSPFFLVVEYFTFGDLRSFMRMCASCQFLEMMDIEQFDIARQIAAGMAYLSGHGFIHRDLAARNVLLGAAGRVAVADFGMSRRLDVNHDYYRVSSRGVKMPVRWMAIESLEFRKFSSASDVWSFGVLLWELCTYGTVQPYKGVALRDIVATLLDGRRLVQPVGCADVLYAVMLQCWELDAAKRPSFIMLRDDFSDKVRQLRANGCECRFLGEHLENLTASQV